MTVSVFSFSLSVFMLVGWANLSSSALGRRFSRDFFCAW